MNKRKTTGKRKPGKIRLRTASRAGTDTAPVRVAISKPAKRGAADRTAHAKHAQAGLPIMLGRETVLFPFMIVPLCINDKASVSLVDDVLSQNSKAMGYLALKPKTAENAPDEPYDVGTSCDILKMLRFPDGTVRILVQGLRRFRVTEVLQREPYFRARVEYLKDD
ncbi:MAG: LON peptidase substrate-binding domain-containing protein, partial [Planctomycetota bacterium]|nr:LON peptidase substrate-binding domain-containing protein [Planctomycetota bacterium]